MSRKARFQEGGRVLLVATTGLALALAEASPAWAAGAERQIRFEDPRDGIAVNDAIRGALDRLDDARCRALFTDFREPSGRTLQEVLDAGEETAQSRLRSLAFRDGRRRSSCQPPSPIAFTTPGSLVIYVCGREFRSAAERSRALADAVVIHELLHSLGLGENPPTPKAITDAVLARCAR
jgi:hypothetical protein